MNCFTKGLPTIMCLVWAWTVITLPCFVNVYPFSPISSCIRRTSFAFFFFCLLVTLFLFFFLPTFLLLAMCFRFRLFLSKFESVDEDDVDSKSEFVESSLEFTELGFCIVSSWRTFEGFAELMNCSTSTVR